MKFDIALKYGFIGGLSSIIFQFIIYLVNAPAVSTNPWLFIVYIPILFCMIFGCITYRTKLDNVISFSKSFINAFIIAIIAISMVNIFTYRLLMVVIDPGLLELIKNHALKLFQDAAEKKGLSDETIDATIKKLNALTVQFLEMMAWSISLFFTILLSLIVSLFVKRGEQTVIINQKQ